MTIQAHADALLTQARTAPPVSPALVVYDGPAPTGAVAPYAVAYIHVDSLEGDNLPFESTRVVARGIFHCVGGSGVAARAVAQRLRAALLDKVLVIPGRTVFPIRHEGSRPPETTENSTKVTVDQVETYRLETEPA